MTLADRAARSRAAFARRFPELAEAIAAQPAHASVVFDGEVPVDILTGDRRIYGGDARPRSAAQVDDFMAKPLRLIMESPKAAGLVSEICINLMHAMERTLGEAGVGELPRGPISAPTFLIVFGLGLGYHLEELIRRTGARWIIVVEPFLEFIGHSFNSIEWEALLGRIEADAGAIHFVTDLDPGRIISAVMAKVAAHGTPFLDGAWIFTHYPLWAFAETGKRLHGAAEFAYVNRGFFEDEIVMLTNAVANFSTHSFLAARLQGRGGVGRRRRLSPAPGRRSTKASRRCIRSATGLCCSRAARRCGRCCGRVWCLTSIASWRTARRSMR